MSDPHEDLRTKIDAAFEDRTLLSDDSYRSAVEETVGLLDRGELRVATPGADGEWTVHAWTKRAVLLYFGVRQMQTIEVGPYEYHDKIPLKHDLAKAACASFRPVWRVMARSSRAVWCSCPAT